MLGTIKFSAICDPNKPSCHCALCDIGFKFSHHMEKLYQCVLCGKSFISWNDIQRHMKSHLGDNQYLCALCDQELI